MEEDQNMVKPDDDKLVQAHDDAKSFLKMALYPITLKVFFFFSFPNYSTKFLYTYHKQVL